MILEEAAGRVETAPKAHLIELGLQSRDMSSTLMP